jgi:proteasome lid subunit RPN8/RPN11
MCAHCKKVIFAQDAFNTMMAETMHKHPVETGGILLGNIENGIWYVMESIEPGPGSIFQAHYFEYDHDFVNYLANARARRYQLPIRLLGLWHRHPGSFDVFSSTDDGTNRDFAKRNPLGAISGLVNIDPEFRFSLYHFDEALKYRKVGFEIDDEKIPSKFFLKKYSDKLSSVVVPVIAPESNIEPQVEPQEEIPAEILDVLLYENELLEKQKLYECSFEMDGNQQIVYSCYRKKRLLGKTLPKEISWKLKLKDGSCVIALEDEKEIPYSEGLFLHHLNERAGLNVEES